ncbi:MAG: universal stress protein [Bacteroidetes bacterium]|nr:universal stress protein [Bacteroidota bacterium]
MRKILLAIDALNINTPPIDFACFVAKLTNSKLTGVFLENVLYDTVTENVYSSGEQKNRLSLNQRQEITEENIRFFKEACDKRGVHAVIHRDRKIPVEEMISESRYADLLIMEADISFTNKPEGAPSGFVKELLAHAECPVIISPESFDGVNEIVFMYNSSGSSVFAIKQFTYLFPEFANKKITLAEVNKSKEVTLRHKPEIMEWLKNYYSDIHFELLYGEPVEELFKYVFEKKGLLLVMGAFGRNALSSFVKESRASLILKTTNLPIFITHH